jgi:hypothetical protein
MSLSDLSLCDHVRKRREGKPPDHQAHKQCQAEDGQPWSGLNLCGQGRKRFTNNGGPEHQQRLNNNDDGHPMGDIEDSPYGPRPCLQPAEPMADEFVERPSEGCSSQEKRLTRRIVERSVVCLVISGTVVTIAKAGMIVALKAKAIARPRSKCTPWPQVTVRART